MELVEGGASLAARRPELSEDAGDGGTLDEQLAPEDRELPREVPALRSPAVRDRRSHGNVASGAASNDSREITEWGRFAFTAMCVL
jgi:hypothetical protein